VKSERRRCSGSTTVGICKGEFRFFVDGGEYVALDTVGEADNGVSFHQSSGIGSREPRPQTPHGFGRVLLALSDTLGPSVKQVFCGRAVGQRKGTADRGDSSL
jgi:hypothetical protein